MKRLSSALVLCLALFFLGCGEDGTEVKDPSSKWVNSSKPITTVDQVIGESPEEAESGLKLDAQSAEELILERKREDQLMGRDSGLPNNSCSEKVVVDHTKMYLDCLDFKEHEVFKLESTRIVKLQCIAAIHLFLNKYPNLNCAAKRKNSLDEEEFITITYKDLEVEKRLVEIEIEEQDYQIKLKKRSPDQN